MINTDYIFNDQKISYEVVENGYNIYLGEKLWITQRENGYIPYRDIDSTADLETCCLKQIEEIVTAKEDEAEVEPETIEA